MLVKLRHGRLAGQYRLLLLLRKYLIGRIEWESFCQNMGSAKLDCKHQEVTEFVQVQCMHGYEFCFSFVVGLGLQATMKLLRSILSSTMSMDP